MDAQFSNGILAQGARLSPVRLLLVDDNPAFLRQVEQVVPSEFTIVATLQDGCVLAQAVAHHQPDIVVLDISLPFITGLALAARLRDEHCPAKVVFLTVHNDPDYLRAALAAGATGYVVKTRLSMDLVPALHAALRDARFISPSLELEGLQ